MSVTASGVGVTEGRDEGTSVPARAIVLLAIATFSATANLRVSDSILPQVAREFSTTVGTAAVIITAFSLAFGFFQVGYGPIGDRLGKYRVICAVCFCSALATGACSFMPTLSALAWGRFVSGVVSAAIVPLAMAWIGDMVPYQQRQGVLARFLTGQLLGTAFGQAAGGVLGDLIGWRSVYIVLAAIHLIGGIAMAIEILRHPRLHAKPPAPSAPVGMGAILNGYFDVIRRPWSRIVLLGVFIEGMAMFGAFAYVGAELHHRFGLGYTALGLALSIYGFGGVMYAWSARSMVSRWGERGLVVRGGLLLAFFFSVLAVTPFISLAIFATMMLGFAYFMLHNTFQTNATQMAPEARGTAMSLFASAFFMGQSLGVAGAALVFDRFGGTPVFLAAAAILVSVGFWFRRQIILRG